MSLFKSLLFTVSTLIVILTLLVLTCGPGLAGSDNVQLVVNNHQLEPFLSLLVTVLATVVIIIAGLAFIMSFIGGLFFVALFLFCSLLLWLLSALWPLLLIAVFIGCYTCRQRVQYS